MQAIIPLRADFAKFSPMKTGESGFVSNNTRYNKRKNKLKFLTLNSRSANMVFLKIIISVGECVQPPERGRQISKVKANRKIPSKWDGPGKFKAAPPVSINIAQQVSVQC